MFDDIEYRQGIEDAWTDLVAFVPRIIGALIVFLVGWFVARLIRSAVKRILTKVNFGHWVEKAGLGNALGRGSSDGASNLLAQIVYWAVMLLTLQLAVDTFGDSAIQDALQGIVTFLPKLFIALIIVVITGVFASRVKELVLSSLSGVSYSGTMATVAGGLIWLVGLFAAFNQIEIAQDIVTTLFQAIVYTIGALIVVMFGIGGIKSAETFWAETFDRIRNKTAADS